MPHAQESAAFSDELISYAIEEAHLAIRTKSVPCKVCDADSPLLDVIDLARHATSTAYPDGLSGVAVHYYRCLDCGLVFTPFFDRFTHEMWRAHIYNADYKRIDPEYAGDRPIRSARVIACAARPIWSPGDRGCDFGGGNGMTADLLTRSGYPFDCVDPYGAASREDNSRTYRIISAIEVLEHSISPRKTVSSIAAMCAADRALVIISTLLAPSSLKPGNLSQWWYMAPRNGHVTAYTAAALDQLAQNNGLEYYRISEGLHLMGRNLNLAGVKASLFPERVRQKLRGIRVRAVDPKV